MTGERPLGRTVEAVRTRVRAAAQGDGAAVFALDGLLDVAVLLAATPDLAADLPVARVTAFFFLARAWQQERPDGDDGDDDLGTALALFAPVWQDDAAAVPPDVAEVFAEAGAGVVGAAGAWHGPARALAGHPDADDDGRARSLVVELLRQAVGAADAGDESGMCLSDLAAALQRRFERTGQGGDIEEAVVTGRRAVASFDGRDPRRLVPMAALSVALRRRSGEQGSARDLDEAVALGRTVVARTAADDPALPERLSNLGVALRYRAEAGGGPADAEEAVALSRRAVALSGRAGRRLVNLSAALVGRFAATGSVADLDDAVAVADEVAADPATTADVRSANDLNRCDALRARFRRTGRSTDLDRAVAAGEAALAALPPGRPERPDALANLGLALHARFGRSRVPGDLDRAVRVLREAVDTTPPRHPDLPGRLSNLGDVLRTRADHGGGPADRDEAVAVGRRAAALDHPRRALYRGNLANALAVRAEHTGSAPDLDEAVEVGAGAVDDCPPGAPDRGACLANLGVTLHTRFALRGDDADRVRAVGVSREAAGDPAAPVAVRVRAAARWGAWSADAGEWAQATAGLAAAVGLLADVAPRDLPRGDQEFELARLGGLAGDAAACALRLGDADRAVRLLERGRGVVLAHALGAGSAAGNDPDTLDLAGIGRRGPVVLVGVSRYRSDALLLTGSGPQVVSLAALTPARLREVTGAYLAALHRRDRPDATSVDREEAEATLAATLAWLWDVVAGPVVERLGLDGSGPPPRVWWCPTGLLSLLPLAVAGRPGAGSVLDRTVSSVTPTLRALAHARRSPTPTGAGGLLVVAPSFGPDAATGVVLPGAEQEHRLLAELFPGSTTLAGAAATRAAVLAAVPRFPWLHCAAHAAADLQHPGDGGVAVADGTLTVADLAGLHRPDAELAVLAACETARTGPALSDEAVHLASTLHAAGYRHVVATLWTVPDHPALRVSRSVYPALAAHGPARTAEYLHAAVRELRDRFPRHPSAWAGYVHVGP